MKKTLSVILCLCMVFTALPVLPLRLAAQKPRQTATSYENDFSDAAAVYRDFEFYYDTYGSTANTPVRLSGAPEKLARYVSVENGRLQRTRDDETERAADASDEACRPYWYQLYQTYARQSLQDFTLTVDARFGSGDGTAFNAITFGAAGKGMKDNGGFSLIFWNYGGGMTYLGTAAGVTQYANDWMLADCPARKNLVSFANREVHIVLTVQSGLASVVIDGVSVYSSVPVGTERGYVSLVSGLGDPYFDNLTVTTDDPHLFGGADGFYRNDFNAYGDLAGALGDDFTLGYDATATVDDVLTPLTVGEARAYLDAADGDLTRVTAPDETVTDGCRAYFQQLYLYYKKQTFRNFTLAADLSVSGGSGTCFQMIHFGASTDGTVYQDGLTFALWYYGGQWQLFLGTAAEARTDLDFWNLKQESGAAHGTYAGGAGITNHLEITVDGAAATVRINGTPVLTKTGLTVPAGGWYAALCLGLGHGTWYDDLVITERRATAVQSRTESRYENNFDAAFSLEEALNGDFSVSYDATNDPATLDRQATPKTVAAAGNYLAAENGAVVRKNAPGEEDADGRRAYWQTVYLTYGRRRFTDVSFSAELAVGTYAGSCFEMLHFDSSPTGTVYHDGFSLVIWRNASGWDLFFGTAAEARTDLDFWYLKQESSAVHGSLPCVPERNYLLTVELNGGTASAYIDGVLIGQKQISDVPDDGYYLSAGLGYGLGSRLDAVRIRSLDQPSATGADGSYIGLALDDLRSVERVGCELYGARLGKPYTADVSHSTSLAAGVGQTPYLVTDSQVVYCDVNADGDITAGDLATLRRELLVLQAAGERSDVNTDTAVDIRDLVRLKRLIAAGREVPADPDRYNLAFSVADYYALTDDGEIECRPYYVSGGEKVYGKMFTLTSAVNWIPFGTASWQGCDNTSASLSVAVGGNTVPLTVSFPHEGGVRVVTQESGYFTPASLKPVIVTGLGNGDRLLRASGAAVRVVLSASPWRLEFLDGNNTIAHTVTASDMKLGYKNSVLRAARLEGGIASGESVTGLGERYNGVDQVGSRIPLWNVDTGYHAASASVEKVNSYTNVPLIHSSTGYSVFFNSLYEGVADIARSVSGRYSLSFDGGDFDYYVYTGTPLENLQSYTALTGLPAAAPKWAFSYWAGAGQSYWFKDGEQNAPSVLEDLLTRYQQLGTMPSAVYTEGATYQGSAIYQTAAQFGTRLLGWNNPSITPKFAGLNYNTIRSFFPSSYKDSMLPIPKSYDGTTLVPYYGDFSNPLAVSLMRKSGYDELIGYGLRGAMVDYGEYIDKDLSFYNRMTGEEMHNFYPYVYNKTIQQTFAQNNPSDGFVLFARAGCAGSQHWAGSFGGDQPSTFDGLRQALYGGLTIGASGFSNWGSDIGGLSGTPSAELYQRWVEFAAFSPFMRAHGYDHNPWAFGTAAQNTFIRHYWLRENLVDYLYSANLTAAASGIPMMQSMAVAFPGEGLDAIDDQYLLGGDLLVCPVVTAGATSRRVTFPSGTWTDLLTGTVYSGGTTRSISAPVGKIPVFVRGGAAVNVSVSQGLSLASGMASGRAPAILTAKGNGTRTTEFRDDTGVRTFTAAGNPASGVYSLTNHDGSTARVLIFSGVTATAVTVDGVPLAGRSSMPTANTAGWYSDTANNRTVVVTGGSWGTVSVTD